MAALQPVRPWWNEESSIRGVRSLLEKYKDRGLREEHCQGQITDQDIRHIYCNLCEMWRELSPLLSMPKPTENDIDRDHIKEREKRRAFFLEWKDTVGSDATYLRLIGALLELGCREDAEKVCELVLSHINPRQETDGPPDAEATLPSPLAHPPKVMKSLYQQLNRNRDQIMYQYAVYVSTLCECIERRGIMVQSLTLFLLNLPALKYHHDQYQHTKLLAGKRKLLESAQTINDVFRVISEECASFLNSGIFEAIVAKYEVNRLDHKDLDYPERLKEYLNKHRMSELVTVMGQTPPLLKKIDDSKMEMTFKLDIELTSRIAGVYDLEIAIADALGLDPLALELIDVTEGCVVVTFLIPVVAVEAVFDKDNKAMTNSQLELLKALPIIWVKYRSHKYDLKNTTEGMVQATEFPSAGFGYAPPPPTSKKYSFVPAVPDEEGAEVTDGQEFPQTEVGRTAPGVVKLVQLSTNKSRHARLVGVNLSELDEDTINTVFSFFARSAEADNDLSQSDCDAFQFTPLPASTTAASTTATAFSPSQVIAGRLLMYQELLERAIEDDVRVKRLDHQAFVSILRHRPVQAGSVEQADSSTENFRFNFAELRSHLLSVCREFFSGERVANCSAKRLLIDLALIIKYCYSFCKRLIGYARRAVGTVYPMQVFSVLCEVVSAILAHLVNIQWKDIISKLGGWIAFASSTGLIQPAIYIPIALTCSAIFVGYFVASYFTSK